MTTSTQARDLYVRLTDGGDFYLVHPMSDKGRAWFAAHVSDARGFTYVAQKDITAAVLTRAGDAGLYTYIDCGIGPAPADIAAHLPANIAGYLRTANQRIPLLPATVAQAPSLTIESMRVAVAPLGYEYKTFGGNVEGFWKRFYEAHELYDVELTISSEDDTLLVTLSSVYDEVGQRAFATLAEMSAFLTELETQYVSEGNVSQLDGWQS